VNEQIKEAPTRASTFPADAVGRKHHPVASGVLDYFPDALVAVANVSWKGNDQHNPGEPLHWAREKSTDEADALMRHFLERGSLDSDGLRHSAKMAWRALALLQKEIEAELARTQIWKQYDPGRIVLSPAPKIGDMRPVYPGPKGKCCLQSVVPPGYVCCLAKGHGGPHVAQYATGEVVEVFE
jgi:hypothetical protein